MSPYEAEMICRMIMSDRMREAERGRLAREAKQSQQRSTSSPCELSLTAMAAPKSRTAGLWASAFAMCKKAPMARYGCWKTHPPAR